MNRNHNKRLVRVYDNQPVFKVTDFHIENDQDAILDYRDKGALLITSRFFKVTPVCKMSEIGLSSPKN